MQENREQRIIALRRELEQLRAELRRARGAFRRATIQDEIRAVARELARMEER